MTRLAVFAAVGLTVSAATSTLAPATLAGQGYRSVTDERLLSPEPDNWLSYRGSYNGWGYGPLDQAAKEARNDDRDQVTLGRAPGHLTLTPAPPQHDTSVAHPSPRLL